MKDFEKHLKQFSQQTINLLVEGAFKKHNLDAVKRTLTPAQKEEMQKLIRNLETSANELLEKYKKQDS